MQGGSSAIMTAEDAAALVVGGAVPARFTSATSPWTLLYSTRRDGECGYSTGHDVEGAYSTQCDVGAIFPSGVMVSGGDE